MKGDDGFIRKGHALNYLKKDVFISVYGVKIDIDDLSATYLKGEYKSKI